MRECYWTLVCARTTGVCLCMPWNLQILYLNLTDFHWLYQPVRARIQYKIAPGLLTFKIYTSTHPTIRPTVLQFRTSSRHLSSSDHVYTSRHSLCWGQDCFSAVGRSATPLQQFETHHLLISLIILTENGHLLPSLWQLPPRTTAPHDVR